MEWVLVTALLAMAFLVMDLRRRRAGPKIRPVEDDPPKRRPTFSRTPRRGSERHKVAAKTADKRSQREMILDLHLRGAIFAVADRATIDGYDLSPLGTVRVDAGPMAQARMARAAGQKFALANAVVNLREERRAKGQWRGEAVVATPRDPALLPPIYQKKVVLIDGSNVINWAVDAGLVAKPSLAPLTTVLKMLQARGQRVVVVFDATIGHRLNNRFMGRDELASLLPLAKDVQIADQGVIADTILIAMARSDAMIIITNDHFRDHPLARHLLKQKGFATPQGMTLLDPRA